MSEHTEFSTSRVGVRWSEDEEKQLLKEVQEMSIENITTLHKRKVGSICSRLKQIGYNMYLNNEDMDKIVDVTKIQESVLLEFFDKIKNKEGKKLEGQSIKNNENQSIKYNESQSIQKELKGIKEQLQQLNNNLSILVKALSK